MDEPVTATLPQGLMASLVGRLRRMWSSLATHCREVEAAKAACERKATLENGKDWVNRCCG